MGYGTCKCLFILLKEGRPQNKKYTTDYDLLPAKHPKKDEFDSIIEDVIKDYVISELLGLDEEDFEINVNALPNFINEASSGKNVILLLN